MKNAAQEPVPSGKPLPPKICTQCPVDPELAGHWKWQANKTLKAKGKWVCREYAKAAQRAYLAKCRADPEKRAARQQYMKEHGRSKALHYRVGAYKSEDKRKGFTGTTINVEQATPLMLQSCHYCEVLPSGGLDRIDNTKGHIIDNVVPCCVKCNGILIDLPYAAKKLLAAGLKEARLAGHLDNWLPPQLRKNGIRSSNES